MRKTPHLQIWWLVVVSFTGCSPESVPRVPATDLAGNQLAADVRSQYQRALNAWRRHVSQPQIREMSNTSYYIDNPEYQAIINLGSDVVPFLIADIAAGEFFLNYAVEAVTRIDVAKLYPDERIRGEQDRCRLWLRWWSEEGQRQYQQR